jgi:hypothetical protein
MTFRFDQDALPPLPSAIPRASSVSVEKRPSWSVSTTAPPPPTASFDDLPNELFLQIIEQLPWTAGDTPWESREYRLHMLITLSYVNKRLRTLTRRYIYETHIHFSYNDLFLRTLKTVPEAASAVRFLHFSSTIPADWAYNCFDTAVGYKPSLEDNRAAMARLKVSDKCQDMCYGRDWAPPDGYDCTTERDHRNADILRYTPNITTLAIENRHFLSPSAPPWLPVLRESVGGNNFLHLKSVMIECSRDRRHMGLRNLLFLFQLPSLKRLVLAGLDEYRDEADPMATIPWAVLTQPSPIQDLHLVGCIIPTETLMRIIEACHKLNHFTYILHRTMNTFGKVRMLHYTSLIYALLRHRDTLEVIDVYDSAEADVFFGLGLDWLATVGDTNPLLGSGSLADLSNLQELAFPMLALAATGPNYVEEAMSSLPPSLVKLHIQGVGMFLCPKPEPLLERIAACKHDKFPYLKSIDIHASTDGFWNPDGNEVLVRQCGAVGIHLSLTFSTSTLEVEDALEDPLGEEVTDEAFEEDIAYEQFRELRDELDYELQDEHEYGLQDEHEYELYDELEYDRNRERQYDLDRELANDRGIELDYGFDPDLENDLDLEPGIVLDSEFELERDFAYMHDEDFV